MEKIQYSDLPEINVTGDFELLTDAIILCQELAEKLNFDYKDILIALNLSTDTKFKPEVIEEYSVYLELNPDDQELYLEKNPESEKLFLAIEKEDIERKSRIEKLPPKIFKFIVEEKKRTGLLPGELTKIANLIARATGEPIERVLKSDYGIQIELFSRIFWKPERELQQAFFLNLILGIVKTFIPISNFTKIGNLLKSRNQ